MERDDHCRTTGGARILKAYRALEMILLRHHFDLFVTIVILDPIIDEVVVDRAPEDVRPGPLDVDGVVGRASDVQDQRSARP